MKDEGRHKKSDLEKYDFDSEYIYRHTKQGTMSHLESVIYSHLGLCAAYNKYIEGTENLSE